MSIRILNFLPCSGPVLNQDPAVCASYRTEDNFDARLSYFCLYHSHEIKLKEEVFKKFRIGYATLSK
jgi:hypothetical protein